MNFDDHIDVIKALQDAQTAEHDQREQARESELFVTKRNGQWEPHIWNNNTGQPRYTFDMTNPIIQAISGQIEEMDFAVRCEPQGGDASKDTAKVLNGIIRNIQSSSNSEHVYRQAARRVVTSGISGWRVKQEYVSGDSFDQDLTISPINNFVDRVWFDPNSELQDRSDARYCFVMQGIAPDEFEERWPDAPRSSVGTDRESRAYFDRVDEVVVGELLYKKPVEQELVLMSNGAVYKAGEELDKVADELAALGITEVKRRTRTKDVVYSRKFSGSDWLEDEKETVFSSLPVIPVYGNFQVVDSIPTYWGVVEKLLDPQRVLNYSESRKIGEGALAPRAKYWMTPKQAAGHENTLQTMNTNANPVQFYNPDPEVPGPPQQNGGAQINQGLVEVSQSMRAMMNAVGSVFSASMGDDQQQHSGIALKRLQDKGDTGNIHYVTAMEIAIAQTGRVLVEAIPKVYGDNRDSRILNSDGSFEMVTLNQKVVDQQTRQTVILNDLSKGSYDVTCQAGPAFDSKQQETVAALTEIGQIDPSMIQIGADILANNVNAPGMDKLAERKRAQLMQAGAIPQSQWTEQEQQQALIAQLQAQMNPPAPDPATLIAQAEIGKVEATREKTLVDAQNSIREQDRKDFEAQSAAALNKVKAKQEQEKLDFQQLVGIQKAQMEEQTHMREMLATMADTLKTLREAMGADAVVGPNNARAYEQQAEAIVIEQQQADGSL